MKNTTVNTETRPEIRSFLALNNDQANTLIDLVSDQIRAQRVYLRSTPLNRTHISALTHFRNLKRLLIQDERKRIEQEEAETWEELKDREFAMTLLTRMR